MSQFAYTAKDPSGATVRGGIEAHDQTEVIERLRRQNLIIITISEARRERAARERKPKLDDLVIFSRQLATMIDAGITLLQALTILGEQIEKRGFRDVVMKIRNDVEGGASFSDALARHPAAFTSLFINMVKAGESSGTLDEILDRLAAYLEKTASLLRKIQSSLIYPAMVSGFAACITIFLIVKVIPTFKGIYATVGGTLPMPTRILIAFSDVVRQWLPFVLLGLGAVVTLLFRYVKTEQGRLQFDRLLLRLPVFGPLFRKVAIARFARTFATLIRSGVPILDALEIVGRTSGNKVVEGTVMGVRSSIREGQSIAPPLAKSGVFPLMVIRMISVGEQTGELEKMLTKIAEFYEDQVDAAVSGLTSLIEPVIIIFLGIVIGGIVIAMFLPIFKLSEVITKTK